MLERMFGGKSDRNPRAFHTANAQVEHDPTRFSRAFPRPTGTVIPLATHREIPLGFRLVATRGSCGSDR
jgi:hypothetical protein